jgi:hypothetical protein
MKLIQFLATCDLQRPSEEILLDLLWLATGLRFPAGQFTLGVQDLPDNPVDAADDTTAWMPITLDPEIAAELGGASPPAAVSPRLPVHHLRRAR